MKLFTIGFTQKSAESFFTSLKDARVARLADVRLNNTSQLAAFAKRDDLRYFARAICGIEYIHLPILAPTQAIFEAYKKKKGEWDVFEREFLDLMAARHVEREVPRELLDGACLLCGEQSPRHCHRRLVAEYLAKKWGGVEIEHLT